MLPRGLSVQTIARPKETPIRPQPNKAGSGISTGGVGSSTTISLAPIGTNEVLANTSGSSEIPIGTDISLLNGTTIQMVAAANLSGERVVMADSSGKAAYPSISSVSNGQNLVGITTGAIALGVSGTIQILGEMTQGYWAWTPGPIWCADNGVLTQTPTTGNWIRQVATAISATTIDIELQYLIDTTI